MGTTEVVIEDVRPAREFGSGALRTFSGFLLVIAVGTTLLSLPASSEGDRETTVVEALFTAVSALCVTGHTIHNTQEHWSLMGELTILALIQIGGLGYMMGTTVILWAIGRNLGLRDRQLLRLYYGAPSMGETFAFARTIALYTFVAEGIGMLILWASFYVHGITAGEAAYWGLFHSVSAFNNAGFSITGADMLPYRDNEVVLATISALVILGGLGALPVFTLVRRRSWTHLPLDSKLIYLTTGALLVFGTAIMLALEWGNSETLAGVPWYDRPLLAFFQSAMSRTAGFSAIDMNLATDGTIFSTVPLMFIGGAAGSTAGGIKVGTFSLLFVAMLATFRGRDEAVILRRRIPERIVRQALVIALGAIAVVVAFTLVITIASEGEEFLDVLFDTVSALGTVGLATGPASRGGDLVHLLYIAAMMVGRFGPLLLVLEMNRQRRRSTFKVPEDSIRLG